MTMQKGVRCQNLCWASLRPAHTNTDCWGSSFMWVFFKVRFHYNTVMGKNRIIRKYIKLILSYFLQWFTSLAVQCMKSGIFISGLHCNVLWKRTVMAVLWNLYAAPKATGNCQELTWSSDFWCSLKPEKLEIPSLDLTRTVPVNSVETVFFIIFHVVDWYWRRQNYKGTRMEWFSNQPLHTLGFLSVSFMR